jgi:hypothetical protein
VLLRLRLSCVLLQYANLTIKQMLHMLRHANDISTAPDKADTSSSSSSSSRCSTSWRTLECSHWQWLCCSAAEQQR